MLVGNIEEVPSLNLNDEEIKMSLEHVNPKIIDHNYFDYFNNKENKDKVIIRFLASFFFLIRVLNFERFNYFPKKNFSNLDLNQARLENDGNQVEKTDEDVVDPLLNVSQLSLEKYI